MNLTDVRCTLHGLRLVYRLRMWAPTSASRAISAVGELLVPLAVLSHILARNTSLQPCRVKIQVTMLYFTYLGREEAIHWTDMHQNLQRF